MNDPDATGGLGGVDGDDNEVEKLVAQLEAAGTVLGPWRRRRAARRLAPVRSPAAVRGLAKAYVSGEDDQVVAVAEAALAGLDDQASIDAVCDLVIATGDERLTALVGTAGHLHSDPTRRALQLFLGGRFDQYAELDFDGRMLAVAHALADQPLRARLAERARASARVDWVQMIAASRDADRMRTLSDREWEAATGILVAGGQWEELWQLATEAPPRWGVLMLRELAGRAWRPEGEAERGGFHRLTDLTRECGDFTRGPVTVESTVLTGHENEVRCLAVTPDGSLLASGGLDGAVRLWRLPSGEPAGVLTGHEGEVREHPARDDMPRPVGPGVYQMVMTPDGGLLATADHRGHVRLWRLPSGEPAGVLTGPGYGVDCLAVTPDGGLLVSGDLRLWRLPAGEPAGWLTGHGGSVRCLAVTPDGALLASGSSFDGAVRLWRLPSGEPAGVLKDRKDIEVWCLAVTPDGRLLASGELGRDLSYERAVRLWHLPSGKPAGVLKWRGGAVSCLAVTPDGGLLVSGEYSGAVRLWRLPAGEPAGVLTGHERDVKHLAVTPDGGLLASGDAGGTVRLWHLPSGESAGVVTAHEGWTSDLVVSPDGTVLASASSDGTVRLSRPVVWAACRTPVGAVDLAAVERVRDSGSSGQERAWATMISALVRWRRRYDIEIGQAPYAAGPTEIEAGE